MAIEIWVRDFFYGFKKSQATDHEQLVEYIWAFMLVLLAEMKFLLPLKCVECVEVSPFIVCGYVCERRV